MKKLKKALSLSLALVLSLAMAVPAFAEESDWTMKVLGRSEAEAFVGKKTFTVRTWDEYNYGAFTKSDSYELTAKNVYVLAKGDTAVFTYKPEVYTAPSGGQVHGSTEGSTPYSFLLKAWSDPDGDGVYDGRLIRESFDGDEYEVQPIDIADAGPMDSPMLSIYEGATGEWPVEVKLSADRVLELFGPNTLVGIADRWISELSETDAYWYILVEGNTTPTEPEKPVEPEVKTANPTNDKLEVNGAAADPTVYKIGGSNYFKIRDVAAVLNGTGKQFAVGYSGGKVTVTSGQPYEVTGKELAGAPAAAKEASPSNDAIVIDGVETSLTVYKIGGSNYFKLRDLGEALNFYVGWEAGRGVYIETDKPYSK